MRQVLLVSLALLLPACSGPAASSQQASDNAASPELTAELKTEPVPTVSETRELLRDLDGTVIAFKPYPSRDHSDLIAGCSHMNPETRPRGSNCHGIFPEECGADRALSHKGERLTAALEERIIGYSPTAYVRFIHNGDTLIEDLRHGLT